MMLTEEELQKLEEESDIRIAGIYREYCSQMRAQNLMDYDDQMLYAYKMLRMDPGLLAYFQKLYPYICVDEAQDTSKKSSMRSLLCWRQNREICLWSEMRIRVSMDSGRLIRKRCCRSKRIIKVQRYF